MDQRICFSAENVLEQKEGIERSPSVILKIQSSEHSQGRDFVL